MNEIQESDKKNLDKIKKMLDCAYDIDVLNYILDDELFNNLFNEICDKYLTDIDLEHAFSDDSEEIKAIRLNTMEQFGEDYILAAKDGEYILLSSYMINDDMKYWQISKINTGNLETAKKIAFLLEFLDNIQLIRMNKK